VIWPLIIRWLASLWRAASFYITAAGAIVVAIGIAFLKGRAAGKAAYVEKREAQKQTAAKKAEEIQNEIAKDPDARVDRRLNKWMRD
jgi:hypothetical protein